MRIALFAKPLALTLCLFRSKGSVNWPLVRAIFAVAILQAAMVALAVWSDNTWVITEGGKGLSNHPGAWSIPAASLLLVFAGGILDRQFRITMATLPTAPDLKTKRRLQGLFRKNLHLIRGGGVHALSYILMVVLGFLAWILNVSQTIDPHETFGHDVFDSYPHLFGFIVFKICIFISWVIVYPIVGFQVLTTTWVTWTMLQKLKQNGSIIPVVEHPDGCYGLRNVGTLNICILIPYLIAFLNIFSILLTHHVLYASILIPLGFITVIFLVTSFVVILPVYSLLWRARWNAYESLRKRIGDPGSSDRMRRSEFTVDRLFYSTASASPYSGGTKVMIAAVRATPVVTLALNHLR